MIFGRMHGRCYFVNGITNYRQPEEQVIRVIVNLNARQLNPKDKNVFERVIGKNSETPNVLYNTIINGM